MLKCEALWGYAVSLRIWFSVPASLIQAKQNCINFMKLLPSKKRKYVLGGASEWSNCEIQLMLSVTASSCHTLQVNLRMFELLWLCMGLVVWLYAFLCQPQLKKHNYFFNSMAFLIQKHVAWLRTLFIWFRIKVFPSFALWFHFHILISVSDMLLLKIIFLIVLCLEMLSCFGIQNSQIFLWH